VNDTLLVDTDVASFLFKNSSLAKSFRPMLKGRHLALAFVSVAEMYKWTVTRGWGQAKVAQLETTLRRYIIVPYERNLAWAWAKLVVACERAGRPIAPSDAWVAAVALRYDVQLVTNNVRHFEAAETLCGLKILRLPIS
jgi:tRNA(fMet)-specific endonuclease VapC